MGKRNCETCKWRGEWQTKHHGYGWDSVATCDVYIPSGLPLWLSEASYMVGKEDNDGSMALLVPNDIFADVIEVSGTCPAWQEREG